MALDALEAQLSGGPVVGPPAVGTADPPAVPTSPPSLGEVRGGEVSGFDASPDVSESGTRRGSGGSFVGRRPTSTVHVPELAAVPAGVPPASGQERL